MPKGQKGWREKIEKEVGLSFGQEQSNIALKVFDTLFTSANMSPSDSSFSNRNQLAGLWHLSWNDIAIALFSLARFGLITIDFSEYINVKLHSEVFQKAKGPSQWKDRVPSSRHNFVKEKDGFLCAHCGMQFPKQNLDLHHIVPLSWGGADAPANIVSMAKEHHRTSDKWHRFNSNLQFYRTQFVTAPVTVQEAEGHLWPVIEGAIRLI